MFLQGVQGGRAKRYSSQRQRPVPEPAPPVHISIMEGHFYDTRKCNLLFYSRVGWGHPQMCLQYFTAKLLA